MEIDVISDTNLSKVINNIRLRTKALSYEFCENGDALRYANKHRESIPQYLQAIMKDRNNLEAHLGAALSYKALGNIKKAIIYLTKACNIEERFEILFELGMCYYICGSYKAALEAVTRAIKINPQNIEAQIWLAIAHEELEEYDMAFLIYDKIIEENPNYINAYVNKGTLEMSIDRYKEAAATFACVIKLNPDFYKAYFGIAICFDKLGRYRDAKRYYTKFLLAKPHAEIADFVRTRVKRLSPAAQKNNNNSKNKHLYIVQ